MLSPKSWKVMTATQDTQNCARDTLGRRRHSGQFRRGDRRINKGGKPKSFQAFRVICQRVLSELTTVDVEGRKRAITRAEKLARDWADSKEPTLQRALAEYAFGRVPDKLDVDLGERTVLVLHYAHERTAQGRTLDDDADAVPLRLESGQTAHA